MDTVTYFRYMERVFFGTAGIKVYKEDYMRSSDEIDCDIDVLNHKASHSEELSHDDIIGMSCPLCSVGFRISKKAYGDTECPCCGKCFKIPVVKKPMRKAA